MTARIWYLTHAEVQIDPKVPVPAWPLTDRGRARLEGFARACDLSPFAAIWTSAERKAIETGEVIAAACGLVPRIGAGMEENDRSATGFLPPEAFDRAADAFFGAPDDSFRGWETAGAAQRRIVGAVAAALDRSPAGDVLFCGHGGVGTLLWCHLAGEPISRGRDQAAGGGCLWRAPRAGGAPETGWQRVEAVRSTCAP